MTAARQAFGELGERVAERWLTGRGWRVVERRFRSGHRDIDLIVEREGVFKECILAIRMAKILGYQVATNTTVYKETDMVELEQLFDFLSDLGVDGHTITPGYEYDSAKQEVVSTTGSHIKARR